MSWSCCPLHRRWHHTSLEGKEYSHRHWVMYWQLNWSNISVFPCLVLTLLWDSRGIVVDIIGPSSTLQRGEQCASPQSSLGLSTAVKWLLPCLLRSLALTNLLCYPLNKPSTIFIFFSFSHLWVTAYFFSIWINKQWLLKAHFVV